MQPFWLKVVKQPNAKFEKGRDEDAGYDLYSMISMKIPPITFFKLPCGIQTAFPPGWVGLILDRSSVGLKGGFRLAGVIDSGYRGEWAVLLANTGRDVLEVESVVLNPKAKAIAQVVFVPYGKAEIELVETLPESLRGEKGYGSTNFGGNDVRPQS